MKTIKVKKEITIFAELGSVPQLEAFNIMLKALLDALEIQVEGSHAKNTINIEENTEIR